MHTTKLAVSLLVMLALALGAAPARAETVNCTPVTSLPAVITVQGVYCFTADLATVMTTGVAIDIQTSNVVLDLNGHKLGGLAAGTGTTAIGIFAVDRRNITIKNGTVRGFLIGIALADTSVDHSTSQGHIIEGIRADLNTRQGISVGGTGNLIRHNQFVSTGGTTASGANVDVFGIEVYGPGNRVLDNEVINTVPVGSAVGRAIQISGGDGTVVENNRLSNAAAVLSTGVNVAGSTADVLVVNNRITKMTNGILYFPGSTGKFRDNLTSGVTTPFSGGTNVAGGNN